MSKTRNFGEIACVTVGITVRTLGRYSALLAISLALHLKVFYKFSSSYVADSLRVISIS